MPSSSEQIPPFDSGFPPTPPPSSPAPAPLPLPGSERGPTSVSPLQDEINRFEAPENPVRRIRAQSRETLADSATDGPGPHTRLPAERMADEGVLPPVEPVAQPAQPAPASQHPQPSLPATPVQPAPPVHVFFQCPQCGGSLQVMGGNRQATPHPCAYCGAVIVAPYLAEADPGAGQEIYRPTREKANFEFMAAESVPPPPPGFSPIE